MYLHTNKKNNSFSCCHVPSAVRIACGLTSACTGGPYYCGSLCRMASLGGLGLELLAQGREVFYQDIKKITQDTKWS